MKSKIWFKLISLLILTGMVFSTGTVIAEENAPPPENRQDPYDPVQFYQDELDRIRNYSLRNQGLESSDQAILYDSNILAQGGPDDYGYIWDDEEVFSWIDAAGSGTNIGLYGGDVYHPDPISIGFDFPFYHDVYSELYLSTKGMVTFSGPGVWWSNTSIPSPSLPNNFIAPMWTDLGMYSGGNRPDAGIFVLSGGEAPNRYLVIEWHRADQWSGDGNIGYENAELTFQLILHEDGDIVFQYHTLQGWMHHDATIGIEDSEGLDGLQFVYNSPGLQEGLAVRFSYPPPSARVSLNPKTQGSFAASGQAHDFRITMRNTGSLGTDSYTLSHASDWPLAFFHQDGVTPITEPVILAQDNSVDLIARITAPASVEIGLTSTATVTATSTLDSTKTRTVSLNSVVPAPFAMVMQDYGDGMGVSSYLVRPESNDRQPLDGWGWDMAVLELPNRNQIYAWSQHRCIEWDDNHCYKSVTEINYTIQDRFGVEVLPPTILQDLSNVQNNPYDQSVSLAVAPNGNIGVIWSRTRQKFEGGVWKINSNIHFAVLNQNGGVVTNPFALTNDQNYRSWNEVGYAIRSGPKVSATEDGRFPFVFGVYRRTSQAGGIDNISFGIRGNQGQNISSITWLTNSVEGSTGFYNPTITSAGGNHVFVGWSRWDRFWEGDMLFSTPSVEYTVRNSSSTVIKPITNIPNFYLWLKESTRLVDGNIIMAGSQWNGITYLIFDGTNYDQMGPVSYLDDPEGLYGDKYITVTSDDSGHIVLTWTYRGWDFPVEHLYYALLQTDGSIVTPPMPFYSAVQPDWGGSPRVGTGRNGQGHTTYTYSYSPYFTSTPPLSVIESELYSYAISADDPDFPDENLVITALNKPGWLTLTDNGDGTAILTGTPGENDVGQHSVVLQVTDLFSLTDVQEFTVTVLAREAPAFTNQDQTTFAVDLPGDFTIEATGVPTPAISVNGTLPSGISFTDNGDGTASLAGTPATGTGGVYPLEFTASNGMLPHATQSFTLTVGEAPKITSDPGTEFTVEVAGSFTVTTTGEPVPEITVDGGWPLGVTFIDHGNGTATISGTPSSGEGGIFQIEITADNGSGYSATQIFTLIVKTEQDIGSAGGTLISNDDEIQITVHPGTVADGTTFVFVPQLGPTQSVPGSLSFANQSFQLTIEGPEPVVPFYPPLIVRIEYDSALLDEMPAETLSLYYWAGHEWLDTVCEGGVYTRGNPEHNEFWFEVPICHLTEFAVMGQGGFEIYLPLVIR